ncbi:MAG: thioredoxin family protein [Deltaproteobacteria bacterium]|nr:thioredoxin family protein [Deltaproteobacteria bacterium]
MTPEEKTKIGKWNGELSGDIKLKLLITEDKRSKEIEEFCEHLAKLASRVDLIKDEGAPGDLPAIQIAQAVKYHAVPLGTELEPFLKVASCLGGKVSGISLLGDDQGHSDVAGINVPAFLTLYVAQQCPFCPVVVQQLLPLTAESEFVHLTVIDGTLFPEVAQSDKIRSVPTVLLDNQFRWTGTLRMEEVVEMMVNRDPAKLSAESLESMLKEGNASQVVEMMIEKEMIFPALVDLLAHEKLFVRIGAMVVMEEIAKRRPGLAVEVIEPLWERFSQVEDPIKGDIIHVLGEIGYQGLIPRLGVVLDGPYHTEVKEAAREAMEKITCPYQKPSPKPFG